MSKIEVLGTGTGMRPELGTSSFLIWNDDESEAILMDCGYTVFSKINELEKKERDIFSKIKTIFISHLHDDHAGTAGMCAIRGFYRHNNKINFVGADVSKLLEHTVSDFNQITSFDADDRFEIVSTEHVKNMECFGCLVNDVFYSGDTKNSLLDTPQAKKAKVIIHEVKLEKDPHHTSFDELIKAPAEIRKKTYFIHYPFYQYEELLEKSVEYGFGGVLFAGKIIKF